MEASPIDPLKMSDSELPIAQKSILIDAIRLKDGRFENERQDRRVEIGSAVMVIKQAINNEFQIDIDGIRLNGKRGQVITRDRNGGILKGGFTEKEYPTGVSKVLLVFSYDSIAGLANHQPSSIALVIKGDSRNL